MILENAGSQVVEAGDGEAGYRIAERGAIDAMVLDGMGHHSDGLGTLKRIRGDVTTAHLPVIALCGWGQSGAEAGFWANAPAVKPFRPAQLLRKVQMVLAPRVETVSLTQAFQPRASA